MRVAVLIPGAHKGLQPIKFEALLAALRHEVGEVEVWNVEPSFLDKLLIGLRTFSPNRASFRARFNASPAAFHGRSRAVGRLAAASSGEIDVVLQVGITFSAAEAARRWPLVIFTDYSVALTRRFGRTWRLDLTDAQIGQRITLEQEALSWAGMVCARSTFVADALRDMQGVPAERLAVVGAGPNILPRGPQAQPQRLLFFGNEFHRKGGDLVLAAFARLREEFGWLELDIVGPESAREDIAGVTWHSGTSVRRMADLLGKATILLVPSRFETWGDVIVEAMAGGAVPVIADLPPMTEIVTHEVNGLVVPGEDPVALADATRRLLTDPGLLARCSRAASDRVAQDFTQFAVAGRIAKALRAAIAQRR